MKKITLTLAAILFVAVGLSAQEEAGTKKVVTTGTEVETKVVEEVKEEKELMKLEAGEAENQVPTKEVIVVKDSDMVVENKTEENAAAAAAIKKMKEERKAELQKSKDELLEIARKEGLLLNEKDEVKRMKQIEEQKKKYAKRKKKATKKLKKVDN